MENNQSFKNIISQLKKISTDYSAKTKEQNLAEKTPFECASYFAAIGDKVKADEYYQKAILESPADLNIKSAYAVNLMAIGNPQKAKEIFESMLDEDVFAASNYTLACDYLGIPQQNRKTIIHLYPEPTRDLPNIKTQGKIHLCYNSKDAHSHVNGRTLAKVISAHDKNKFEITFLYGNDIFDATTKIISENVDRFVHISDYPNPHAMPSKQVYGLIKEINIDVLIDCDGHTNGGGRLFGVFAKRPSLVNLSGFGYPNCMRLPFFDYQIPDTPIYNTTNWSERVDRSNMPITFAVISHLSKISHDDIKQYDALLTSQPQAQLVYTRLKKEYTQNKANEIMSIHIPNNRSRVSIVNMMGRDYAELYHGIDLLLDTSNWNLHGTMIDALSCGVPLICTICNNNKSSNLSRTVYKTLGINYLTIQEIINNNIILDRQKINSMQQEVFTVMQGYDNTPLWVKGYESLIEQLYKSKINAMCSL